MRADLLPPPIREPWDDYRASLHQPLPLTGQSRLIPWDDCQRIRDRLAALLAERPSPRLIDAAYDDLLGGYLESRCRFRSPETHEDQVKAELAACPTELLPAVITRLTQAHDWPPQRADVHRAVQGELARLRGYQYRISKHQAEHQQRAQQRITTHRGTAVI